MALSAGYPGLLRSDALGTASPSPDRRGKRQVGAGSTLNSMRAAGGVFVGSIVIWAISCQSALKFCRPNDTQFPGVAPGQLRRAGNDCGVKMPSLHPSGDSLRGSLLQLHLDIREAGTKGRE